MTTQDLEKKIFIVGCPRSGTTLLQSTLLNIPQTVSMPETHFFDYLANNYFVATRSLPPMFNYSYPTKVTPRGAKRVLQFMTKNANLQIDNDSQKEIISLAGSNTLTVQELFNKTFSFYKNHEQKILIEKSPSHVFHIPYIKILFPDSIIINIIRDPRDTFVAFNNELLAQQGKKERTIHEFCFLWNNSVSIAKENNIKTIIFEKFVNDPIDSINDALKEYGFKIEQIDLRHRDSIVRPNEPWHEKIGQAIIPNNFGQFNKHLTEKQVAEIEALCKKNMTHYGYQTKNYKRDIFFSITDLFKWYLKKTSILFRIIKMWLANKIANLLNI